MNKIEKALEILNSIVPEPFDREMKTTIKTINKVFDALKVGYGGYDNYGEDGINLSFTLDPNKDTEVLVEWLEK